MVPDTGAAQTRNVSACLTDADAAAAQLPSCSTLHPGRASCFITSVWLLADHLELGPGVAYVTYVIHVTCVT